MDRYAAGTLLAASMTSVTSDPRDPSNSPEVAERSSAIACCVKFLKDREFIRLQTDKTGGENKLWSIPSDFVK